MLRPLVSILDEHPDRPLGSQIHEMLKRDGRWHVELAPAEPAVRVAGRGVRGDLIVLVLPAPAERARQLLDRLQSEHPGIPLLPVLRAQDLAQFDDVPFRTGDFLVPPLREPEVLARVQRLLLDSRASGRRTPAGGTHDTVGLGHLIGEDPAFVVVKRKLPLIARHEAPVLLTGETGTGKGLCAEALHYLSRRVGKPFLPVNCGAISLELFERELFGHEAGAFTGAGAGRPGLVAEAEGGTLFLDEIEALSVSAQVKLLRLLEDKTYHVVGSPKRRLADVRIFAASNGNLAETVREGAFRKDLFYRLAVLTLTLPPLRERRGDIPLLVAHFLARHAAQEAKRRRLSARAVEALCHHTWPGNVRELENVLEQALALTEGETIEAEDLPIPRMPFHPADAPGTSFQQRKAQVIEQFEKSYLEELLQAHRGNVTRAARAAHTGRRTLGRLIKKHQLSKH
jgi:DNA-binding NtrC family response regulator